MVNQLIKGLPEKHLSPEEFDEWFNSLNLYQRMEFKRRVIKSYIFDFNNGYSEALDDFKEWIDEAKKDLELIWSKREPIDWLYHTGEIKLELEDWKRKWFGDSS